jgi:circadian clock protein KaiC
MNETARPEPPAAPGPRPIPKVATGIPGLDEVLGGGIPEGLITVVNGGPGAGKTVFGVEFAFRSAAAGDPVIFVSFEERLPALKQNALSLGFDLSRLEEAGALFLMDQRPAPDVVLTREYDLNGFLAILSGKARSMGASRVVIDAIDVLLRVFSEDKAAQSQLHVLLDWLREEGITALLTSRVLLPEADTARFLEYVTDCLIRMDMHLEGQLATRRLRVIKYRGAAFGSNDYPCVITEHGIHILPVSAMSLPEGAAEALYSSGNPGLDEVLGGGFRGGTSILVSGNSGIGKTTLLCTFAEAACRRGEKVLYISFEESPEGLVYSMAHAGIDLRPVISRGSLRFIAELPEKKGAEEHLLDALMEMERRPYNHVILDAVSATHRFGTTQASFDYLMRLTSTCRERGMTLLMSNQTAERSIGEISGVGVSSLMDALLVMRYVDKGDLLTRILLVLKSRGMSHSPCYHEFRITKEGIVITGAYLSPACEPKQEGSAQ